MNSPRRGVYNSLSPPPLGPEQFFYFIKSQKLELGWKIYTPESTRNCLIGIKLN